MLAARRTLSVVFAGLAFLGCGSGERGGSVLTSGAGGALPNGSNGAGAGAPAGAGGSLGVGGGGQQSVEQFTELWYSVDQLLVRIRIDASDGSVIEFVSSKLLGGMPLGQNAITMLSDGSLLGARLGQDDERTHFFYIAEPPRDGSDVTPVPLGPMPGDVMLEGLYTDCDGRLYGMDTGADDVSADGNRLLRFTGDVTGGDFDFVVVSDLATADVADIDDMSPGIDNNQITDNPGLAIDTSHIHAFDYETGSGTEVATGGTYGIHALGGPLFLDARSRLYVLSSDAELFEIDPVSFAVSGALGMGPTPAAGTAGWSGLAGPLTDCQTGFTPH